MNITSFSESKSLVIELWELRDEAISNAFLMQDLIVIMELVDEIIKASPWFLYLKEFGPTNSDEKSALGYNYLLALVTILTLQIVEICNSRLGLHQRISKYFVQAKNNAFDANGHELIIHEIEKDDMKSKVKYEIKPKPIKPNVLGVNVQNIAQKKQKLKSTKLELTVVKKRCVNSKARANFTIEQRKALKMWLFDHKNNPFPTEREKAELCEQVGITHQQLKTWFVNNRKRLLANK